MTILLVCRSFADLLSLLLLSLLLWMYNSCCINVAYFAIILCLAARKKSNKQKPEDLRQLNVQRCHQLQMWLLLLLLRHRWLLCTYMFVAFTTSASSPSPSFKFLLYLHEFICFVPLLLWSKSCCVVVFVHFLFALFAGNCVNGEVKNCSERFNRVHSSPLWGLIWMFGVYITVSNFFTKKLNTI